MLASRIGAIAGVIALTAGPVSAEPRVSVITQWTAGAEGAALNAFGDLVTKAGAKWENNSVSGFTTDMMNKLRADIIAGHPPAMSQLKGPEIKAWSAIAPTVNLNELVAEAGYEKMISPDLAKLHKVNGDWVALPLQIYRVNTLFASKKAMDKIGATALPTTWDEFNVDGEEICRRRHHACRPWRPPLGGHDVFRDRPRRHVAVGLQERHNGPRRRRFARPRGVGGVDRTPTDDNWMSPSNAGQHWSVFVAESDEGRIRIS